MIHRATILTDKDWREHVIEAEFGVLAMKKPEWNGKSETCNQHIWDELQICFGQS